MNETRNKLIELKPATSEDTRCFISVSRFQSLSVVGNAWLLSFFWVMHVEDKVIHVETFSVSFWADFRPFPQQHLLIAHSLTLISSHKSIRKRGGSLNCCKTVSWLNSMAHASTFSYQASLFQMDVLLIENWWNIIKMRIARRWNVSGFARNKLDGASAFLFWGSTHGTAILLQLEINGADMCD